QKSDAKVDECAKDRCNDPFVIVKETEKMTELLSLDEDVESHFGFRETPFGVTPDPRFFYSNPVYVKALAALVYGIKAKKGFMLLTGEVGTGKTILLRKLMRNLEANVQFVFVSASHLTSHALVELMVQDLGLASKEKPGSRSEEHTSELQSPDHLVCRL